jgi:hypothetical protein
MHAHVARGGEYPKHADRHASSIESEWGNGSGNLDPARVDEDLVTLHGETRTVRTWATKTVAHLDADPPSPPTFGDLDRAIAYATAIFRKYGRLLTGEDHA